MTEDKPELSKAMDFDLLRKEGIRLLQEMSGTEWTDYNLHDPGVTMLEYLCFAITDLAYRTNFDIEDLLTQKDGTIDYEGNSFIKPAEALSSNAVTIKDFRKILLDSILNIANVWIVPISSRFSNDSIKGLYKFYVQVSRENVQALNKDENLKIKLKQDVQRCFTMHRNLCEDASNEIHILNPEDLIIKANIVISQEIQPENIMAQVYYTIEKFLNPAVRYYTEKELLNKGYTLDEIYSGPLLRDGFILDDELKPRNLRIDPSALTKVIAAIEGVVVVNELTINDSPHFLSIDVLSFPYFNIEKSFPGIVVYCDEIVISVKQSLLIDIFQNLKERAERRYVTGFNKVHPEDIAGDYKGGEYHSIQKLFPAIYGIGEDGLSGSEDALRIAHSKQLKGYLMFFEQIMANYLAQLEGINGFFSNKISSTSHKTYYTQPISSVPNFSDLVPEDAAHNNNNWKKYFDNLSSVSYSDFLNRGTESTDIYFKRKNKMLDHLLARFNESLNPYPLQLFDKVYGKNQTDATAQKELHWKSEILQFINEFSHARSLGFNYFSNEEQGVGYDFRKKMYQLLYIMNPPDKSLVQVFGNQLKVEKIRKKYDGVGLLGAGLRPKNDFSSVSGVSRIITLRPDEFEALMENGNIKPYPENHGDSVFQNQPVSFLRHALNINNYRLAVNPHHRNGHLLLYKALGQPDWLTVNRYNNSEEAIIALDAMIDLLIGTSANSEGFYLIEHLLLRPRITSDNFGFRFYNEDNVMILESRSWTSFEEREKQISALITMVRSRNPLADENFMEKLLQNYKLTEVDEVDYDRLSLAELTKKIKSVIFSIKLYIQRKKNEQCRFEMIARQGEKVVVEDYYSFRMSILLPEWPARFQDKVFKEFLMGLFQVQAPVHLRLKFYWLNIQQMTVFEGLHASWLNELELNSETEERMASSNLSDFLKTLK